MLTICLLMRGRGALASFWKASRCLLDELSQLLHLSSDVHSPHDYTHLVRQTVNGVFFPLGSCDQGCQSSLKMGSTCLPRVAIGWDILQEMAHKIDCLWRCHKIWRPPWKWGQWVPTFLVNWGPPASSAVQFSPQVLCAQILPKSWPVYIEPILRK